MKVGSLCPQWNSILRKTDPGKLSIFEQKQQTKRPRYVCHTLWKFMNFFAIQFCVKSILDLMRPKMLISRNFMRKKSREQIFRDIDLWQDFSVNKLISRNFYSKAKGHKLHSVLYKKSGWWLPFMTSESSKVTTVPQCGKTRNFLSLENIIRQLLTVC